MSSRKSKKSSLSCGRIPKQAPKFISPFLQYVAKTYDGDTRGKSRILECDKMITTLLGQHWTDFTEHMESKRPAKRQKTEQPYNESKLIRDTKAIVSKLETMEENISNLNVEDVREQMDQIYLVFKHLHDEVHKEGADEVEATEPEQPMAIDPVPIMTFSEPPAIPAALASIAGNTDTQTQTTTVSSTSATVSPPPPPAFQ